MPAKAASQLALILLHKIYAKGCWLLGTCSNDSKFYEELPSVEKDGWMMYACRDMYACRRVAQMSRLQHFNKLSEI